jgi:hypothetical protein
MTRILETDENGILAIPPEVLGGSEPHARYKVEVENDVVTLKPAARDNGKLSPEDWRKQWLELAEKVGQAWKTEKSAVEVVSEMRR